MNAQPTIVILEDERPQLLLLQATLRGAGDIAAFSDPIAALDYLREKPADAALIDVGLGAHATMNGIEFIRAVRAFDSDLCIIIRTGNDTAELADQAIELGAFRRSIKTKQSVDELRRLTQAAIEETQNRRRASRDAATSAELRVELGEALGTMDEEQAIGDAYRVFLEEMRNRVTAVAAMAELLCREMTTLKATEYAVRNRELVGALVAEMGRYFDAPLTPTEIGAAPTRATVNGVIETLRRRFALAVKGAHDGQKLKVSGLSDDLFVEVPPLRLLAALRHVIEFCWDRAPEGSTTLLSVRCCERIQHELDGIREEKLVFSRSRIGMPALTVAFRIACDLPNTSAAQIRHAIEDYSHDPRRGCLHTVGTFVDATRSVFVVYQRKAGGTIFELYVPMGAA